MPKEFTKQLLISIVSRDNATLLSKYDKGGRRTVLEFQCKCGNKDIKTFCSMEKSGAICKSCIRSKQVETLSLHRTEENRNKSLITKGDPCDESKVYSRKGLDECIKRDLAQLIGTYPILFGSTLIKFKCKCGSGTEKQFQDILGRTSEKREKGYCGALCDECNKKRWLESREKTNIERYGKKGGINNNNDESKQKSIETSMKKYNVPNPNQAESVKQKKVDTCLKKWGTENPAQNQEIMERTQKNAKKYKKFVMPSGEIRNVQGYEPFAITKLLETYTENQIKTERKDVPRIQYEVNGKIKFHFPDIYVPDANRIIEVKSTWTYKCKEDNIAYKKKAAEDAGFTYDIWIFDKKGNKIESNI